MEGIQTEYNDCIGKYRRNNIGFKNIITRIIDKNTYMPEQTVPEQVISGQTASEQITPEQEMPEQAQPSAKSHQWLLIFAVVVILAVAAGAAAAYLVSHAGHRGYHDYTVQKQQYYVEYSDEYPYWDVLTVEYPVLEGTDEEPIEQLEQINAQLYDVAMDRVNYWHLNPNAEVKQLQEEYSIFSSDVECNVTYHSQYLMSVSYKEIYAPINPVWYVYITQRAMTADLLTGESYALKDILRLDEEFVELWADKFNEKLGEEMVASEDENIFVDWFNCADKELEPFYEFVPFYYITKEGNFVIGVSLDPKVAGISNSDPSNSTFYTELTAEEIAPYRRESMFWDRYDKSESTGEILRCKDKHDNIWLGDQASVWDYWEEE